MNDKKIKDFIKKNIITLIFTVIIVVSLFMTKQAPYTILNELIQNFTKYAILVLALIIPIMSGMGFNFSIAIGAIAGNIGIIMAANWGLTGIVGFIVTVVFSTIFASIFGVLVGVILNKAKGHEMITSFFINYLGSSLNQLVLLFLVGTVIPVSKDILLSSGIGLRNSIDIKHTLLSSSSNILQIPFFLFLLIISFLYIVFNIYRLKKNVNKIKVYTSITVSVLLIVISILIMYTNLLPVEIGLLKNVRFSLISAILISGVIILNLIINRTKLGQSFIAASNESNINSSKVRITAILISTLIASLGQIVNLQTTGLINIYGSHISVGTFSVLFIIVGGATIKKANVKQALIGLLLVQSFLIITLPITNNIFNGNISEVFRSIVMNCIVLYAFTMNLNKKNGNKLIKGTFKAECL